jgi:zinc protease
MSANQDQKDFVKIRMDNGLEIRLKEMHIAPVISSWIWYRVGSRNERAGITGASHWVEHMQFKGTPAFPAGILDRIISRDGGYWNALTWLDWTAYYETMPSDRMRIALELEADRMVNSVFDPGEFDSERTVIISERQGHENEPSFRLAEEVQAAAFRVSPYHHEVIGDATDLERMSRDELYEHYRRYYVPSNAVLAAAGDFQYDQMLESIEKYFGPIAAQAKPEFQPRLEPPQGGERRVVVEGPEETPYVQIAYHVPGGSHSDFIPLSILDSILAGPSSLNLFGYSISNKTSRLYRALVEGEMAASVSGNLATTIDPYLYIVHITVRPDRDPEDVISVFDQQIEQVLQSAVKTDEVAKAIKQAQALFAYGSESTTNQAFWLGFSEMFADYGWFQTFLDRIAEVEIERVVEVARHYLLPSNRVVGIFRPPRGRVSHD